MFVLAHEIMYMVEVKVSDIVFFNYASMYYDNGMFDESTKVRSMPVL